MNAVCPVQTASSSRLGGLLRDFTAGLKQQMFYWGRDVVHPSGNLLVAQGFAKRKSGGLQGTSCYQLDWQQGRIELHGACAGWYGPDGGFVFIRPHGKCHGWLDAEPPVPGHWPCESIHEPGPEALRRLSLPLLEWWLHYEREVRDLLGPSYRVGCHRHFKKLAGSKPWLPPGPDIRWLERLRSNPASLERWKSFAA
jgi:hypothetical protein